MDNNNIQDQDLSVELTAKELAKVQGGALKCNRSFSYGIINPDTFHNILKPVVLSVKSIILVTVLLSPAAMAQQQSLTTQVGGLEKHVLSTHSGDLSVQPRPCKDNKGRPKICTCTDRDRLSKADPKPAQKKANPCNPKKGEPVEPKACRDYILKG
jgi:hypothetical protein